MPVAHSAGFDDGLEVLGEVPPVEWEATRYCEVLDPMREYVLLL